MNNIKTRVYRNHHGKLKAESGIHLAELDRTNGDKLEKCELELRTYKTDRNELVSIAAVGWVSGNYRSFIMFHDYNKTWICTPVKRVTEKVLSAQHDKFVTMLEDIKADVINFYNQK